MSRSSGRRRLLALAALAVALGTPAVVRAAELAVLVRGAGSDRVLYRAPVSAGATFALSYVHSSEHVPVRGTFRIEADGALTVVETRFAGFGPGLPELQPGDDWHVEGGMIVYRPRHATVPDLVVRVTSSTGHRFIAPDGRILDLSATLPPGTAVRIAVR